MDIGWLNAFIELEDSQFHRGVQRAGVAFRGLGVKAAAAYAAVGSGTQVLGGVAASVGQLAGVSGLLPGVLGAVALAQGTVKVGTQGMGDAMKAVAEGDAKKLQEAMAKLAPSAREVVTAVQEQKGAWDQLQLRVQDRLFKGLGAVVSELGDLYLPKLSNSMTNVAGSMNRAAHGVAEFFGNAEVADDVGEGFSYLNSIIGRITREIPGFVEGFYLFGRVGVEVLSDVTGKIEGAGTRFANWMADLRSSGELEAWIRRGVAAFQQLVNIIRNVGNIVRGVFRAAGTEGLSFFGTLEQLTGKIAQVVNSTQGQTALQTFFQTAATLAGYFQQALDLLLPVLPPLVQLLGTMATTTGGMLLGALQLLLPILTQILTWLNQYPAVVQVATVALGTLALAGGGAIKLAQTIRTAKTIIDGAMTVMKSRIVATAAVYIARWTVMAATSMARAAVMAASWVVAMGPIGWVTAAVVGLVALVIANWDKVKAFTAAAWSAVSNAVSAAWNWITSTVSSAVSGLYNTAVDWLGRLVSFFSSLPGRIVSALGNVGSILWNSGVALVRGFWDGIMSMWNQLVSWVRSAMGWLRNLWPFSPAKDGPFSGRGYVTYSGRALTSDFAESLRQGMPRVLAAGADVAAAAHRGLNGRQPLTGITSGRARGADQASVMYRAVRDALDGARMEVDGRGVARLVNRQNLTGARRGVVAAI